MVVYVEVDRRPGGRVHRQGDVHVVGRRRGWDGDRQLPDDGLSQRQRQVGLPLPLR